MNATLFPTTFKQTDSSATNNIFCHSERYILKSEALALG